MIFLLPASFVVAEKKIGLIAVFKKHHNYVCCMAALGNIGIMGGPIIQSLFDTNESAFDNFLYVFKIILEP